MGTNELELIERVRILSLRSRIPALNLSVAKGKSKKALV